uniref:Uncharacterized protein n=1 Tax=Anguilla anguilla TaxID=7936 RepID=A0A0E9RGT2_ANGAN
MRKIFLFTVICLLHVISAYDRCVL